MERKKCPERDNWQIRVSELGLSKRAQALELSWDESCYYTISHSEGQLIGNAAKEIFRLCLRAMQHVIDADLFEKLGIPLFFVPAILRSWNEGLPPFITLFRLLYDGSGPPRLLSIEADAPRGLRKAGIIQWDWKCSLFPEASQYNEVYEYIRRFWLESAFKEGRIVVSGDNRGEISTARYLADILRESELAAHFTFLQDVGWNEERNCFVDNQGERIEILLKIYPWHSLVNDPFFSYLSSESTLVFEPPWKALMSSAGFMALLWELFPEHELLTPWFWEETLLAMPYPLFPALHEERSNLAFSSGRLVYSACPPLPLLRERYVCLHSWMVDRRDAGLAFCEYENPSMLGNAKIVPHILMR